MGRHVKRKMLEMADTMMEVNDSVRVPCTDADRIEMTELLTQCQEAAVGIGTGLESLGEEYTSIVHLLETYCEDIFRLSTNLTDAGMCRRLQKQIRHRLVHIRNRIRQEVPEDRKEVVFLPYKASMWDSLESVWKAADADENTDAYVIPIPYYDRNPDGSFREGHYEGDLYPDDVPVTFYKNYDFEERRPDVIYIHNPYDEGNYVTSVHPYFYCKNIKKFTDKLVYIPYFILNEIDPGNQAAIESIKHFCFTPGTFYADQVILQSENMRQIYINEYIKAAKEIGFGGVHVDRGFLEKKFLGTGSPKIDKILHTRKEDLEIPPGWLKIIEKPDRSWKKIVFYNTGVHALLQHGEKMLRKMEAVFEIFKAHQDEAALLWRPHPLIQATIKSMRPQMWEAYKKIRDTYVEEGWGIYDDTADLDRAVVISDAYYGDMSSVMQLCRKAGLPVMLQNMDILEQFQDKSHVYRCGGDIGEDVVWAGNRIWFCPQYFNGLFCMDSVTGKISCSGEFPNEEYGTKRLYASMKLMKGKIYFIPFSAKSIAVYDIETGEFSNILIDEEKAGCKVETDFLFMGVAEYKNYLFLLPVLCRAIMRLNVDSQEIEYITNWFSEIRPYIFNRGCGFFRRQVVVRGDKLYAPFCNANAVLELDCNTLNSKIHILGEEKTGYSGICREGDDFYLSPMESGDLYKWNVENQSIRKIKVYQENTGKNSYVGVLHIGHKLLLFPSNHEDGVLNESIKNIEVKEGAFSFAREEREGSAYYDLETGLLTMIPRQDNRSITIPIMPDRIKADIKRLMDTCRDYIFEIPGATIMNMVEMLHKGH